MPTLASTWNEGDFKFGFCAGGEEGEQLPLSLYVCIFFVYSSSSACSSLIAGSCKVKISYIESAF